MRQEQKKKYNIQAITNLVEDKNVCLIGSLPPKDLDLEPFDVVVRCNDHWFYDHGRCDILFHIGASNKIKLHTYLAELCDETNIKLLCLYRHGAEAKKVETICRFQGLKVWKYDHDTRCKASLRKYFTIRGGVPSTGLNAAYILAHCFPSNLLVTGMDLYASDPTHEGWAKHQPLSHVYWYNKLNRDFEYFKLGKDLRAGIRYWIDKQREAEEDD